MPVSAALRGRITGTMPITEKGDTMPKIIFAIDQNGDALHNKSKFLRHLDTLRAMGKLEGEARCGIGHWVDDEGVSWLEPCYCLEMDDYVRHVLPHGWVNEQHCVVAYGLVTTALMTPSLTTQLKDLAPLRNVGDKMPAGCWIKFDGQADYWSAA